MSSSKSLREASNEKLVSHLLLKAYEVEQFQGTEYRFSLLIDQEELREEILRRMAAPAPAPLPTSGIYRAVYRAEWIDAFTLELTALDDEEFNDEEVGDDVDEGEITLEDVMNLCAMNDHLEFIIRSRQEENSGQK